MSNKPDSDTVGAGLLAIIDSGLIKKTAVCAMMIIELLCRYIKVFSFIITFIGLS
jgi:hypothetical protein